MTNTNVYLFGHLYSSNQSFKEEYDSYLSKLIDKYNKPIDQPTNNITNSLFTHDLISNIHEQYLIQSDDFTNPNIENIYIYATPLDKEAYPIGIFRRSYFIDDKLAETLDYCYLDSQGIIKGININGSVYTLDTEYFLAYPKVDDLADAQHLTIQCGYVCFDIDHPMIVKSSQQIEDFLDMDIDDDIFQKIIFRYDHIEKQITEIWCVDCKTTEAICVWTQTKNT